MTQSEDYLAHYGVKGMKWGVRHDGPKSAMRNEYDRAKAAKRSAHKAYSKDFNKAYYYRELHPFARGNSKAGKKVDQYWSNAQDSANRYNKAKANYKSVKQTRKKAIKSTYRDISKKSTIPERMIYNNATRKKAAKYVVDANMSVADANKKAKSDARRNTLIAVGVYGAVTVGSIMANSR